MRSIAERFYGIVETIRQQPVNPKSVEEQLVMLKILASRFGLCDAVDLLEKAIKNDTPDRVDLVVNEKIDEILAEQEYAAGKVNKDSLIPAYQSETYDRLLIELEDVRVRFKAEFIHLIGSLKHNRGLT